jgi:hypothetical protein
VAIKGVENGELMETIRLAIWRIIQTSFEFFFPLQEKKGNEFIWASTGERPT